MSATSRARELVTDRHVVGARPAYVLLSLAALTSSWTGVYLGSLKLVDDLLVAAALVGSVAIITRFVAPPRWLIAGAAAVLVVLALTTLFAVDPLYMMGRYILPGGAVSADAPKNPTTAALQWLMALAVLPLVATNIIVKSGRSVTPMMWAFATGAAISSLVAVTDYYGLTAIGPTLIEFTAQDRGRQNGLASHVNNLGFAAAVAAPIALHIMRRHRFAGLAVLLMLGMGALLSGSRAAQVGIFVMVLGTIFLTKSIRRHVGVIVYILAWIATLGMLFGPSFTDQFNALLRFGADNGAAQSDQGRFLIAQQAVEDLQRSPVYGIGYSVLTGAHSIYLQILATGGLMLAAGMACYWIGMIRAGRRLRGGDPIASFLLFSIATWLVCGVFENMLVERYLYFPVSAVMALAASGSPSLPRTAARLNGLHGVVEAGTAGAVSVERGPDAAQRLRRVLEDRARVRPSDT